MVYQQLAVFARWIAPRAWQRRPFLDARLHAPVTAALPRVALLHAAVLVAAMLRPAAAQSRAPSAPARDDDARRTAIAQQGRTLFQNTTNHCKSFRDLVAFAAERSGTADDLLNDLLVVMIGNDLRHRGTGKYYIGSTKGARGDKGFRAELRDNSPQAEHAFAAIYIGKRFPPGSTEALAVFNEFLGGEAENGKANVADMLLYAVGGDAGQRLSGSNYKQLPGVIDRTMCEEREAR